MLHTLVCIKQRTCVGRHGHSLLLALACESLPVEMYLSPTRVLTALPIVIA